MKPFLLLACLSPLAALPHEFIMTRLYGVPYSILGLCGLGAALGLLRESNLSIGKAGLVACYFALVAISIVLKNHEDLVLLDICRFVLVPSLSFLIGCAVASLGTKAIGLHVASWSVVVGLWGGMIILFGTPTAEMGVDELLSLADRGGGGRGFINPILGRYENATGVSSGLFPMVLAVLFLPLAKSRWTNAVLITGALAFFASAVQTQTRTGFILAIVAILLRFGLTSGKSLARLSILACLALVTVLIFLVTDIGYEWLPERLRPYYTQEQGLSGRTDVWHDRATLIEPSILGRGTTWIADEGISSHNQYLDVMLCFGSVAFVAYVGIFAVGLLSVWKSKPSPIRTTLLCALLVIGADYLVESPVFSSRILDQFAWTLLGIALVGCRAIEPVQVKAPVRPARVRSSNPAGPSVPESVPSV